jgi:hypothetical protein
LIHKDNTNLAAAWCVLSFQEAVFLMLKFLIWCVLFVMCWPLALVALVLYPIVWLVLLPFRIVGIAVGSVLALVWALVILPAKVLRSV